MNELLETTIQCPYYWENIHILIDICEAGQASEHQEYIEDCQVCCRPINFSVIVDINGDISITPRHENE